MKNQLFRRIASLSLTCAVAFTSTGVSAASQAVNDSTQKGNPVAEAGLASTGKKSKAGNVVYLNGGQAVANGTTATLLNNQWMAVNTNGGAQYFKFKASSTGILTVGCFNGMKASLCDSSKRSLCKSYSVALWGSTGKEESFYVSFGITKGKTYYLKMSTTGKGTYVFAAAQKKVKEYGKSSMKKAKTLTLKKKYTGVVSASDKNGKADWFKIKIKKTKKYQFIVNTGKLFRNVKITTYVYKSGSKMKRSRTISELTKYTVKPYNTSKKRLKKGTVCYIRISKTSYGNGNYQVQAK